MIAIKEMKMPNSCSECNLTTRKTWNYVCSINLKDIDCAETKRPKDCPLVEIEERKVGKWIDKEKIMFPICSKCGLTSVEKYSFCPNCGTKMDEEVDEKEE